MSESHHLSQQAKGWRALWTLAYYGHRPRPLVVGTHDLTEAVEFGDGSLVRFADEEEAATWLDAAAEEARFGRPFPAPPDPERTTP